MSGQNETSKSSFHCKMLSRTPCTVCAVMCQVGGGAEEQVDFSALTSLISALSGNQQPTCNIRVAKEGL